MNIIWSLFKVAWLAGVGVLAYERFKSEPQSDVIPSIEEQLAQSRCRDIINEMDEEEKSWTC